MFDTKEKLEEFFRRHGIKGEWVHPDVHGFCRDFRFVIDRQECIIEWYCNYSELQIGAMRYWFTHIDDENTYPCSGEWWNFIFKGADEHGIHLNMQKAEGIKDEEANDNTDDE